MGQHVNAVHVGQVAATIAATSSDVRDLNHVMASDAQRRRQKAAEWRRQKAMAVNDRKLDADNDGKGYSKGNDDSYHKGNADNYHKGKVDTSDESTPTVAAWPGQA